VFFGVVKAFGEKGLKPVPGFVLAAKGAQGEGEALAGEIGFAGVVDDEEATELDDEFEAVGAGDGVPANVIIAFLESLGGSSPAEDGDEFWAVRIGVCAVDSLPEDVSGGASSLEVMTFI
jgi:hypothetical protein